MVEQSVVVQPGAERPPHQLSLMQLEGGVVVSTLVPADMHEGLPGLPGVPASVVPMHHCCMPLHSRTSHWSDPICMQGDSSLCLCDL